MATSDPPTKAGPVLLQDTYHKPLLRELERIARDANIPRAMIYSPMAESCSEEEIAYIRGWRRLVKEHVYGFAYVGQHMTAPVPRRMMAMAAACLRNYISARVMQLQDVITALRADNLPNVSLLLIPNFYLQQSEDRRGITEWQASLLSGMLYNRQAAEQQTVVYVQNMDGLAHHYGVPFRQHIEFNFKQTYS